MDTQVKRTKIKCSVRFALTITRITQLDNIEFYLDAKDEEENVVIDSNIIRDYVIELWHKDKIKPGDGTTECYREESYDDDIDEVVSFEIIEQEKFTDPAQTTLPLTEGNNK